MPATGYDTVAQTAAEWRSLVPASPEVISAYINGLYANVQAARDAFPLARHLSYDVNGSRPDADILDVERFDATISQCPGWWHAWHRFQHVLDKPAFYISAASIEALVTAMLAAGIARSQYLILSAHYENVGEHGEHICGPGTCGFPQADGTQWDDHGAQGQNTDRLIYSDAFFPAPKPPPKPPAPPDYSILTAAERKVVLSYDGARKQPVKYRLYLLTLRAQLKVLASAVWVAAHTSRPPSWDVRHRGERFQMLYRRSLGQKLA